MQQLDLGQNLRTNKTRKREFLNQMECVVPWAALVEQIAPYYPDGINGRPPFSLHTMLRIHFMQQWFTLSDPAMEEALFDVPLYREFAQLGTQVRLPDESTILRFRHRLEKHELTDQILATVNALLEIVAGFSAKPRGLHLVVLGNYSDTNAYHRAVKAAASADVRFVGAIYDKTVVQALRFHSAAYVHGHQVGGTNPSLVEALGAGNAVIAHDNRFNRWVVGEGAMYFNGADGFAACMDALKAKPEILLALRAQGQVRFKQEFTWSHVLEQYEALLTRYLPG